MTASSFGHRRSIRRPAFDYDTPGAYFVTIVAHERGMLFGEVLSDSALLSPIGLIVEKEWRLTPELRPQVLLDEYVVMPNHFHAIVWIGQRDESAGKIPTLARVIGGFKSAVARRVKREGFADQIWQRNYYERVIRNERELLALQEYIVANPRLWAEDEENPLHEPTGSRAGEPWAP